MAGKMLACEWQGVARQIRTYRKVGGANVLAFRDGCVLVSWKTKGNIDKRNQCYSTKLTIGMALCRMVNA